VVIEQLNRRLIHHSKYVFSPWSLVLFRSGRSKPYDKFVSINELQGRHNDRVTVTWLDPAEEYPLKTFAAYGLDKANSVDLPVSNWPATYVATLRGGWCHGRNCDWVGIGDHALNDFRTLDGRLLPSNFPLGRLNPRYYRRLLATPHRFPKPTRITGRVIVLNKCVSCNYFHWLSEVLPRLELARRAGFGEADAYLVDKHCCFQRQTLAALGVPADKIIEPHNGLLIEADELIIPSFARANARRRLGAMLRNSLDPPCRSGPVANGRRIFISRRRARKRFLENERQVGEFLAGQGFETHCLETYPLDKQIRLMSEAAMVVGVHGAGLASILVCQPGLQVTEILQVGYQRLCYPTLSAELKHRHRLVFAQPGRQRGSLRVSLPTLDEAICAADEERRPVA
jgi:hypothetical protein